MIDRELISRQLAHCIQTTDFSFLGPKYQGKVRDSYRVGERRVLITTDRLSCFDIVLTSVPFKGQCLNQLAVDWFNKVSDICTNHLIDVPHPNVMIAEEVEILPIEVVVRDYIAGSAWRDYQAGRAISGIQLPTGMAQYQKLPETLITPSTKADQGKHDLPISEAEIMSQGIIPQKTWHELREIALALFARGRELARARGLLLVDTKYEFGMKDGKIILADEIHTLDSSRYWIASSYEQNLLQGNSPQMLDKEPMRQWLIARGFQGEGVPPVISDEKRIELSEHYIHSYELVSGSSFRAEEGDALERMAQALRGSPFIRQTSRACCA